MTTNINGTQAKEIALYFIERTTERATPAIIAKTITQAKSLLKCGYTKKEITDVIDYLIDTKHVTLYSLGYVNSAINNILLEIKKEKNKQKKTIPPTFIQTHIERNEVELDDETTKRNKSKLNRFGIQPRLGKKFTFDMFEK